METALPQSEISKREEGAENAHVRRNRYWSRNWARYEDLPEHERFVNREFNANGTLIYEALMGRRKKEDGGLPQEIFDAVLSDVQALTDKSDFSLAALVRAYMVCEHGDENASTMTEKQRITAIAALMNFPYWLSEGASSSSASTAPLQPRAQLQSRGNICYWTENHQALLLSSYYIATHAIPSLSSWANDHRRAESSRLLSHFLAMKRQWGFAELNSPVYSTITLAGLLNVVDFCDDSSMRNDADAVLRVLLDSMSAVPTSDGSFVCATTRFFDRDIVQRELRAIQAVVDIVFGIECISRPNNARSFQTAIVASSNWLCDAASSFSWQRDVNVTLPLTTQPSASVKGSNMCGVSLADVDRMLFNFASGRFFPPSDIKDHIAVMKRWHLFSHPHFRDLKFLKSLPTFSLTTVSSFLSPITLGHAHGGGAQRIFRRGPVSMSSLEGHEQMFGFQKLSFVVCIDADTIVWLECGCRRKIQDNLRDAITPKVSQSEDGRSATIQYTQHSHVLRFLHSKMAGSKGSGVELMSSSARTIFRPDDDLSGGYCAEGVVHVRPPSHSVFIEQPEEVRENVYRHAFCSQTNQAWQFDLTGL